jgi:hypothetical protein
MRSIIAYALLVVVAVVYVTPAMVARRRMRQAAASGFLLDTLLAWAVTGRAVPVAHPRHAPAVRFRLHRDIRPSRRAAVARMAWASNEVRRHGLWRDVKRVSHGGGIA